jgi:hypothetical protein
LPTWQCAIQVSTWLRIETHIDPLSEMVDLQEAPGSLVLV